MGETGVMEQNLEKEGVVGRLNCCWEINIGDMWQWNVPGNFSKGRRLAFKPGWKTELKEKQ